MIKKKTILLATLSIILGLLIPIKTHASEFNFAVNFELPDNQINKDVTYIDLLMEKGQKQDIPYTIVNDTDKEISIDVEVHSATTNSNGVIEYGKSLSTEDNSLKYDMGEIVSYNKEVTVPAKGNLKENITIAAPDKDFEGIIVGGITFQEHVDGAEKNSNESVGIVNRFSQVKAIVVRTSNQEVKPDLKLINASAEQKNARNVISVNLQNPNPAYMFGLETDITIYKKNVTKPYLSIDKQNIDVAPNSNFDLPLSLNGKKLENGSYEAVVKASWKDKNWELKKEFSITNEVAKKLNSTDVDIDDSKEGLPVWVYILIGAVLILLICVLILYLLYRANKKKTKRGKKK